MNIIYQEISNLRPTLNLQDFQQSHNEGLQIINYYSKQYNMGTYKTNILMFKFYLTKSINFNILLGNFLSHWKCLILVKCFFK